MTPAAAILIDPYSVISRQFLLQQMGTNAQPDLMQRVPETHSSRWDVSAKLLSSELREPSGREAGGVWAPRGRRTPREHGPLNQRIKAHGTQRPRRTRGLPGSAAGPLCTTAFTLVFLWTSEHLEQQMGGNEETGELLMDSTSCDSIQKEKMRSRWGEMYWSSVSPEKEPPKGRENRRQENTKKEVAQNSQPPQAM